MMLLSKIKNAFGSDLPAPEYSIRLLPSGCQVALPDSEEVVAQFEWAAVQKVTTYKLDLITTDCIYLLFDISGGSEPVKISQEWPGFSELMDAMSQRLEGLDADWNVKVMKPAFKSNLSVIYDHAFSEHAL